VLAEMVRASTDNLCKLPARSAHVTISKAGQAVCKPGAFRL
jgi:hypothetical protein